MNDKRSESHNRVYAAFLCLIVLFIFNSCGTKQNAEEIVKEIRDGRIHLVLNERTACFSLYYLAEPAADQNYMPLFNDKNLSASYTSISIDGRVHKFNDRIFRQSIQMIDGYPAYKFESNKISVYQMFNPVTTASFNEANRIMITYIIVNISEDDVDVGLRLLLDTELGEGRRNVPFIINSVEITGETRIEGNSDEKYWISGNDNVSLTGSIKNPVDGTAITPGYVHFASWRRLDGTRWDLKFSEGRTFSGDSAVSYFYEPAPLKSGQSFTYTIFLTAQESIWYGREEAAYMDVHHAGSYIESAVNDHLTDIVIESHHIDTELTAEAEEPLSLSSIREQTGEHTDIVVLQMLQSLLHQFISGEIDLSEQDLIDIENAMNRHR